MTKAASKLTSGEAARELASDEGELVSGEGSEGEDEGVGKP